MATKTVIDILKSIPLIQDDEIEIFELPDFVSNWPEVAETEEDDDQMESLDLENWSIYSITPEKMVMAAGGDWQTPLTFTLVPDGDELRVTDSYSGMNGEEMSDEEVIALLK